MYFLAGGLPSKPANSITSPRLDAFVILPMAGCKVDTSACLPPYSSQVSRGIWTGRTRSAISAVSFIKLLKHTTKRSLLSRACLTPLFFGRVNTGSTLLSSSSSAPAVFKEEKICRISDRFAAASTRCRSEKSIKVSLGSRTRLSKLTVRLAWTPLRSDAPVLVPSTSGRRASMSWMISFSYNASGIPDCSRTRS